MIALNYTVLLNGYNPWLNIRWENYFIETSVVLTSVMLAFNKKIINIKYILSLWCLYIANLKVECEIFHINVKKR